MPLSSIVLTAALLFLATAVFTSTILLVNFILSIQAEKNSISANSNGLVFGEAMRLFLKDNLPFTTVSVSYEGKTINIPNILIDTGSGTTILAADIVSVINIAPSPEDTLFTIRGVGGNEVVFSRRVEALCVGEQRITDFEVEIGGMDYGFEVNGILGMDYLISSGAVINLRAMELAFIG
ncbi:MAG TPA: retropepsin-like aspartic protease [Deltaproteobacteria bacterium]|nr:retropepsin-like aspartic protease [Deltaproteobacteria bacterium]HXK46372.1 retropepsin-like aspartic protease [Deltaproteobacteria bacterium]